MHCCSLSMCFEFSFIGWKCAPQSDSYRTPIIPFLACIHALVSKCSFRVLQSSSTAEALPTLWLFHLCPSGHAGSPPVLCCRKHYWAFTMNLCELCCTALPCSFDSCFIDIFQEFPFILIVISWLVVDFSNNFIQFLCYSDHSVKILNQMQAINK